eukprot:1340018-Pleurochrysis_carterae.AAC.1
MLEHMVVLTRISTMRAGPFLPLVTSGCDFSVRSASTSAACRLHPVRSATRPTSAWYDSRALRE